MNKGKGPIWEVSSDKFKEIVENSSSFKEILEKLGSSTVGGHYKTLKKRIHFEYIDISGLEERRKKLQSELNKSKNFVRKPLDEVMTKNSYYNSKSLKKRLLEEGLIKNECKLCGLPPFWNGKELVLQLDHKNGDSRDNRLENLRLLCPNCHSQTDTYTGRNIKNKDKNLLCEGISKQKIKKEYKCSICEKSINKGTRSGLCRSCSSKNAHKKGKYNNRKTVSKVLNRPSKDELFLLVIENGFTETGRIYNVSSTTIKNWCRDYNIDIKKDLYFEKEKVKYSKNKSGLKFVLYRDDLPKKYIVSIWYDGKSNHFGSFETAEKAARVADEKMVELFGEDVLTNNKLGLIDY